MVLQIQKSHPDFVCYILSGDFCFLHCCQALFFLSQFHISGHNLYPHWYHFNLVTFLTHGKIVSAITELIHCY